MQSEGKTIQGAFSILGSLALSYLGVISVPILMLCVVMVLDYITGMAAAWKAENLSSKKGISGVIKKLYYLIAVCVGIIVDWVIYSGLQAMNVSLSVSTFFGLLVTIWLIVNELISILENLKKIGVPLPKFLLSIVKKLKITTENVSKSESEDEKEDEKRN